MGTEISYPFMNMDNFMISVKDFFGLSSDIPGSDIEILWSIFIFYSIYLSIVIFLLWLALKPAK